MLQIQGPRPLSPLEIDACSIVFPSQVDPDELRVEVVPSITVGGAQAMSDSRVIEKTQTRVSCERPYTLITISNEILQRVTHNLNGNSTRENTEDLHPGNLWYLAVFIHEVAHHWQQTHGWFHLPKPTVGIGAEGPIPYNFTKLELMNLSFMSEQHASAAAIYFLLVWQKHHEDDPKLINLTGHPGPLELQVGKVNRYEEINHKLHDELEVESQGLWISEDDANHMIEEDFQNFKNNLTQPPVSLTDAWNYENLGKFRTVNEREKDAVKHTFGAVVGQFLIEKIRIKFDPKVPGGRVPWDTCHEIWLNPKYYKDDLYWLAIFIHEAVHIWQRNTGRHGSEAGEKKYVYDETQLSSINSLGAEEHASAVTHWFMASYGCKHNLVGIGINKSPANSVWSNTLGKLGYDRKKRKRVIDSEKLQIVNDAYALVLREIRNSDHLPGRRWK